MAKHKKHDKIVKDYERQNEKMQKLREKKINPNLFNLF